MFCNFLTGVVQSPLMQVEGGAGGSGAPSGGSAGASSSGNPTGANPIPGSQPSSQSGTPSGTPNPGASADVSDWDENRQFRVNGKVVKAGDYVKGFQSQFTKASQELAKLKKERAAELAELQRFRQAANPQAQDPNAGGGAMLQEIENAAFIDGKTMGGVIRDLQGGIRERDMVMMAMGQKLQQMERILGELHGTSLNQNHETKLRGWLKNLGLDQDQDAFELADLIYRGYEGDSLDEEFPQIFEQRWKQMQNAVQRRLAAERARARNLPFTPGKGGNAGPGKPQGLRGNESPKELADFFFSRFGGQSDT